eukprot:56633_1
MPVRLSLGDVVLLYPSSYGDKQSMGLIKYIGSIRSSSCDITKQYVGIELTEPVENGHDGHIEGYQYFQCKKYYGIHAPITNVIKICKPSEIMFQLQDVISIFKTNLGKYIRALNERDTYLNDLCLKQKKLETLISTLSPNSPNQMHQMKLIHQSTAPLTPIADSNTIREMERRQKKETHQTLTQMMDKVDNVITSQSLAIKLNAKQVGAHGFNQYTPMSMTQTPMDFSPNTIDSGTPSSYTPAPNPKSCPNIHANNPKSRDERNTSSSKATMIVHNGSMSIQSSTRTDTTDGNVEEPDPLLPPSMDPIAETHSSRTHYIQRNGGAHLPDFGRQNMSHNTLDTRSPSQPHLLNRDTNLSTLSPHSPGPEYDDINNDDIHSTSSYFSAGSSAYNTPKSLTANAHCLLTSYNYNRNLSKQSSTRDSRPRNSSKSQKDSMIKRDSKSRSKSKNNTVYTKGKRHSSQSHSKGRNVPHISTGPNTPTFSAANDGILSGDSHKRIKTRKSKELKKNQPPQQPQYIATPQQRTTRSSSAQFTPHSFRTIHEEKVPGTAQENSNELPPDSPRFMGHHSTPVFTAQQHEYYTQRMIEDDDDALTPELPSHGLPPYQDVPPHFDLRYKSENIHQFNPPMNQAKYQQNPVKTPQPQRSSLPPRGGYMAQHANQNTIAVPQFNYNTPKQQQQQMMHAHYTGSLRDIHQKGPNMMYPQHQNAPQLDHWIEAPPPRSLYEGDVEEIVVDQPQFSKAKSMPAKPRFPSRQSIDMNPYIDQQYIFQPQTSPYMAPHNAMYYSSGTSLNSSGTSLTASPHIVAHPPQQQQVNGSPVMLAHSPLPHQQQQPQSHQLRPPAIMTSNNVRKQVISNTIGSVKFAPRKSVSKMLKKNRRTSKNDAHAQRRKSYQRQQQMLNQNNRQCISTQQKQMMAHNTQYPHQHQQHPHAMPNINMSGFEMTDAMYD